MVTQTAGPSSCRSHRHQHRPHRLLQGTGPRPGPWPYPKTGHPLDSGDQQVIHDSQFLTNITSSHSASPSLAFLLHSLNTMVPNSLAVVLLGGSQEVLD